jgi:hypothetical protein
MSDRVSVQVDEFLNRVAILFRKFESIFLFLFDFISMFVHETRLEFKWFLLKSRLRDRISNQSDSVVVSLTSHSPRFRYLRKTLISLLFQDFQDYKVVVNLSEYDYSALPLNLKKFEEYGVEFRLNQNDLRVFMKLIPTLQNFPNSTIVTADDDIYYRNGWLSSLIAASLIYPNSIVGYRSVIVPRNSSGTRYADWPSPSETMQSKDNLLLTGVAGVLYPPRIFRREIHKLIVLMELSPRNDDLVYFVAANFLELNRVHLQSQFTYPKYWNGSQKVALWKVNVGENFNDSQFKALQESHNLFQ